MYSLSFCPMSDQTLLFLVILWASGRSRSAPSVQLFWMGFLVDDLIVSSEPRLYGPLYWKFSVFLMIKLPSLHQSDPFCFPSFRICTYFLLCCYHALFLSIIVRALFCFCVDFALFCWGLVWTGCGHSSQSGHSDLPQAFLLYFFG